MDVALVLPDLSVLRVDLQRPVQRLGGLAVAALGGQRAPPVHMERCIGRIAIDGLVERRQRASRVPPHEQGAPLVVQYDRVGGVELPTLVEGLGRLGVLLQLH